MKVQAKVENIKEANSGDVRVAFTFQDSAMTGNFNKLMKLADAKAAGFFPGDGAEVDMTITATKKPPRGTDVTP